MVGRSFMDEQTSSAVAHERGQRKLGEDERGNEREEWRGRGEQRAVWGWGGNFLYRSSVRGTERWLEIGEGDKWEREISLRVENAQEIIPVIHQEKQNGEHGGGGQERGVHQIYPIDTLSNAEVISFH